MLFSQNLKTHLWKDRVLVITANNENSEIAKKQLLYFQEKQAEMLDRELVLYFCIGEECRFYNWNKNIKTYKTTHKFNGFKVELFGLDGTKKMTADSIQKPKVFFDLIDKMPMRRRNIKIKNK